MKKIFAALIAVTLMGCIHTPPKPDYKYTVEQAHLIKRKLFVGILWRDIPFEENDGQRDMIREGKLVELAEGIVSSPEFRENIQPKDSPSKIVGQFFRGILGRDIDPSGEEAYVKSGMPYNLVVKYLVTSQEFIMSAHVPNVQPLLPIPECNCSNHNPEQVACGQPGPDSCGNLVCTPVGTKDCNVKRNGKVRLSGHGIADDDGEFFAIGATLFSAARWYKFDRPHLERNLKTLADGGFHYIRALGTVAWAGREIDPKWDDYKEVLAGVTDLAYDKYGLRVEWTIFGDAQISAPTMADKRRVVNQMLEMSRGRENKIIQFEIANESWQNGFGGDQGVADIRELAQYVKDNTSIITAVSAPSDGVDQLYAGGVADFVTLHLDRTTNVGPDFEWRTVRQPWGEPSNGMPVSSNEPIGPGSSVACIQDPELLVAHAIVAQISGFMSYVYHTRAGIGNEGVRCGLNGDQDLSEMPGINSFKAMKKYMPNGVANWQRENHYWAGHPFIIYGDGIPNHMTTDGAQNGVMRAYAAHSGSNFVVILARIVGTLVIEAKSPMEFDMINTLTGEVVRHVAAGAGEKISISGYNSLLLKGVY